MSSSQLTTPSDEHTISIDSNAGDNQSFAQHNEKEIKVETVASSSQVSSIQQSESIMDQIWSQTQNNDPNTIYDWRKHAEQKENGNDNDLVQQNYVTNPPLLPSILSENTTSKNETSNTTIHKSNSCTATPSVFHDLVHNLNINENHNFTTADIDNLALQYVERKSGIITKTPNNVSPEVQHRLACLFGYSSNTTTLPQTLCKFLQDINCVYPFQMINKLEGDRIQFAY